MTDYILDYVLGHWFFSFAKTRLKVFKFIFWFLAELSNHRTFIQYQDYIQENHFDKSFYQYCFYNFYTGDFVQTFSTSISFSRFSHQYFFYRFTLLLKGKLWKMQWKIFDINFTNYYISILKLPKSVSQIYLLLFLGNL